ncbi:MAG: hypothetical protein NVS3B14_14740 [Ktedonobacteraceae bacterium]
MEEKRRSRLRTLSGGQQRRLDLAIALIGDPDLIFLDIGLPELDGYDVLRLLKSNPNFDHTAVIMLSAHDGILDRLKSHLAGARGHFTKPFKIQELLSAAH